MGIEGGEEDPSLSDLQDKRRSGRPLSAVNPGNSARFEVLIREDRRVTIDHTAEGFGLSYESGARLCNGCAR